MNQKGFIQIPLLIGIIIAVVITSGIGAGVVLHRQDKLPFFSADVSHVSQVFEDVKEIEEVEPQNKEESILEEIKEEGSQVEQELEKTGTEVEKASAEAERLRREVEETQRLAEEQRRIESQRKAEEKEGIANIEKVDKELSQLISTLKNNANIFSQAKNEANSFIFTVRNTMNKYPNSFLIQQSGQQLINELNNLSFISGKLFDIENNKIQTISSFLGSGKVPSSNNFSTPTAQYENYRSQYDLSNTKIKSLMETFVINEKMVLEETTKKKEEELQRKTKATQVLTQLNSITQGIDNQLTILNNQIKEKEAEIERERNRPGTTMSQMEGRLSLLIPQLNSLINQWNSLLNKKNKIITITYKIDNYFNYGTPLSAEDRAFLWSLGISF